MKQEVESVRRSLHRDKVRPPAGDSALLKGKGQLPSPTLSRPSLIHAVLKARRGQEDQGMKELRQ